MGNSNVRNKKNKMTIHSLVKDYKRLQSVVIRKNK